MNDRETVLVVYMTASGDAEAQRIAELLITRKLAACVNILGTINSMYEWNGRVQSSTEVAMIAKTTAACFPELEKSVKKIHSYECPCIVAWPLTHGHSPFLDWVKKQTG